MIHKQVYRSSRVTVWRLERDMPSTKPRVALTLKEDTKKIFDEAADVLEIPTSRLIVQVLEEAQGAIYEMALAVRQTKSDPVKGLVGLKNMVVDARQEGADVQVDLEDEIARRSEKGSSRIKKAK
jgi:uncharacterized protein (DUF1778 family)